MKKIFSLLLLIIFVIFISKTTSAFLPPGTGGGDLPPLPPPPTGDSGSSGIIQTDVISPIAIISSSSANVPAGTSVSMTIETIDDGGLNTGMSYFMLRENNNAIHTEQCYGSGSCSKTITFTRERGSYAYTVDAYDVSGNRNTEETTSPDSLSIAFGNRNPLSASLIYPGNNSYVLVSNPALSWSASSDPDGDSITYEVEIDNATFFLSTNLLQSSFSEGLHRWRVRTKDSNGAFSGWTVMKEFRVDTMTPQVFNSNTPDIGLGANEVIMVDAADEHLTKVEVEINGTKHLMSLQSGNTYAYILSSPSLGIHNLRYYATDAVGRVNSSVTDSFNVSDTAPPVISFSNQTVSHGSDISFSINISDFSPPIAVSISHENFTIASNLSIKNNKTLALGNNVIRIKASDFFNNVADKDVVVSVVDNTPPVFSPLPSNQIVEAGKDFSYDVNASDFQIITYSVNDTRFNINPDGLITNSTPLLLGNHSINITVTDLSNNALGKAITIFVFDTSSPSWSNLQSNYSSEYGQNSSVQISALDFQSVIYSIDDMINFAINAITGIITKINNLLGIGDYPVQVNATDASGKVNSSNITIQVKDTAIPSQFSLLSPANNTASKNNTPTLSWMQSSDLLFDKYIIEVDDNSNFTSLISSHNVLNNVSNTSLQITLPADGTFYWRVKAYDTSGNIRVCISIDKIFK